MRRLETALLAAAALTAVCGVRAATVTPDSAPIVGSGAERGITRVLCDRGAGRSARMRAVVLDLGNPAPTRDVLLTPAHGLPLDAARIAEECHIVDVDGAEQRIERFWLPPRDRRLDNDWAVLMTGTALAPTVGRLRAGLLPPAVLEKLIAEGGTVDVLLTRAAADLQECRILAVQDRSVFRHSCRAWSGLSGSPIVAAIDGEPLVIGITIARDMRPPSLRGPLFIGVGLAVHAAIAEAIGQAAEAAAAPY